MTLPLARTRDTAHETEFAIFVRQKLVNMACFEILSDKLNWHSAEECDNFFTICLWTD